MSMQTFTHLDTLKLASGLQSIQNMIDKITTNGSLDDQYDYLFNDLFVVFNRIYNNGQALDTTINDTLYNAINHCFDLMHYHINVAIGLAAGVITTLGVGPELSHAEDWSTEASKDMTSLSGNVSQIVSNDETLRYVKGLQNATSDPAINTDELIRTLFWTIIVNLQKPNVSKEDFEEKLAEIHLSILSIKNATWAGIFKLDGLTINLVNPGKDDDLVKVSTILADIGDVVGVLSLIVMGYHWKANGVSPLAPFRKLYQRIRSTPSQAITDEAAAQDLAIGALVGEATVEVSVAEVLGGVLGIIGVISVIIGAALEIAELSKALVKVKSARDDFNNQYGSLKSKVQDVITASEGFRKHT
jgi:hypothetical protein